AFDDDLERERMLEAEDVLEVRAEERHGELVLAVEREHMVDPDPADGAERQPVEMHGLGLIAAHLVRRRPGYRRRIPDRERAHDVGGLEIALEQRRRDAEEVTDVVEPVSGRSEEHTSELQSREKL